MIWRGAGGRTTRAVGTTMGGDVWDDNGWRRRTKTARPGQRWMATGDDGGSWPEQAPGDDACQPTVAWFLFFFHFLSDLELKVSQTLLTSF